ncbi:MAG: glycosyltransferase family 4 protein [Winogradskyella arenosi]
MKINVSQPGRQHTNLLLQILENRNVLGKFYTIFASNKLGMFTNILPKKIKSQLRKRFFSGIPSNKIEHQPAIFLKERLGNINSEKDSINKIYKPFDQWVSETLQISNPDIIIGYENANLTTFQVAKELNIVTILDLAQIHHDKIVEIHKEYDFLDDSYTPEVIQFINNRKSLALKKTDYIFTLSSFAKDSLVTNGISADKIFLVNLGIKLENFFPKMDYNKNPKFRFLFVGTITRRKGLELIFEAFRSLNLSDAELILIGPMSNGSELLKRNKDLCQYFPYMHHEELADQYRQADVFVFPSYLDSWAQTVVEAMACGTPAIVSENTGAKDAVKQGGGFVVSTGDVNALEDKMLYLYEHRDVVEQTGRKAAKIATQYTVENYHNQIIEALEQIADEKNKG